MENLPASNSKIFSIEREKWIPKPKNFLTEIREENQEDRIKKEVSNLIIICFAIICSVNH